MKSRVSAGLLLYRMRDGQLEVLLAHPGGPFFANKDDGHWTVPKGEAKGSEDLLATAIREVREETGIPIKRANQFIELGSIEQKGGKIVHAWGIEYSGPDPGPCRSNFFYMEWPAGSGEVKEFPEIDRAQFFPLDAAKAKIKSTQIPLLERLVQQIATRTT